MEIKELKHIGSTKDVARFIAGNLPFEHEELSFAVLSGSQGNSTFGEYSDVDICTIMQPRESRRIDIQSFCEMASQLNLFCHRLKQESGVSPVVIATIRLEEAQIALAQMINPNRPVAPIHWLHYPSVEFLATNEPPGLARGLIRGQVLKGDAEIITQRLEKVLTNPVQEISGLDWLTDSLRILLANAPVKGDPWFPFDFLRRHSAHNLDYFWKWRMIVPEIEKKCQTEIVEWPQAKALAPEVCPDLVKLYEEVRRLRHHSNEASLEQIIDLHSITFALWPL